MRAPARYYFSDKRHQFHNATPHARAALLNGPPRLVAEDEHRVAIVFSVRKDWLRAALRCCRTPIERDIAHERSPRPANGAAIDPRCLDRDEKHPVEGGIAPLQGFVVSGEVEHAEAIFGSSAQNASCVR
jgi:hypothetical protein